MTRKMFLTLGCFASFVAVAYATTGPTISAQVIRLVQAGALVWTQTVNSSKQLVFRENSALNAPVLTLDSATGVLILRTRTAAQILALASPVGGVVFNSTSNNVCFSSSTTAGQTGQWIQYSTTTSAGAANTRTPCS